MSMPTSAAPRILPLLRHRLPARSRAYTTGRPAIVHISKANVYPLGASSSSSPSLRNLEWTVNDGEAWAVVPRGGGETKSVLFQALLGKLRISPPPPALGGLYPFLEGLDPFDGCRLGFIAFGNPVGGAGGVEGKERREMISSALVRNPSLLLLDEPMSGLDVTSRNDVLALLRELHASGAPKIIMGMRALEELPAWITHVLEAGDGVVTPRKR